MKRTFVAIKIPLPKEILEDIQEIKLALSDERIKWVESWNLHITLFFLGDTEEDKIEYIIGKLHAGIGNIGNFDLKCRGVGVFKNINDPRVIWLGIDESETLNSLKQSVDQVMSSMGFQTEKRSFKPHLTLGRVKFIKNKNTLRKIVEQYKDLEIKQININEVVFYESILTPKGPMYKVLEKIKLV